MTSRSHQCKQDLGVESIGSRRDFLRWARFHHPDKVSPRRKQNATERFQVISGCVDDFCGQGDCEFPPSPVPRTRAQPAPRPQPKAQPRPQPRPRPQPKAQPKAQPRPAPKAQPVPKPKPQPPPPNIPANSEGITMINWYLLQQGSKVMVKRSNGTYSSGIVIKIDPETATIQVPVTIGGVGTKELNRSTLSSYSPYDIYIIHKLSPTIPAYAVEIRHTNWNLMSLGSQVMIKRSDGSYSNGIIIHFDQDRVSVQIELQPGIVGWKSWYRNNVMSGDIYLLSMKRKHSPMEVDEELTKPIFRDW